MGQDFARETPAPVPGTTDPNEESSFAVYETTLFEDKSMNNMHAHTKAILGILQKENYTMPDSTNEGVAPWSEATSLITMKELAEFAGNTFNWVLGNMSIEEVQAEAQKYVKPAYALRCLIVENRDFREASRLLDITRYLNVPLHFGGKGMHFLGSILIDSCKCLDTLDQVSFSFEHGKSSVALFDPKKFPSKFSLLGKGPSPVTSVTINPCERRAFVRKLLSIIVSTIDSGEAPSDVLFYLHEALYFAALSGRWDLAIPVLTSMWAVSSSAEQNCAVQKQNEINGTLSNDSVPLHVEKSDKSKEGSPGHGIITILGMACGNQHADTAIRKIVDNSKTQLERSLKIAQESHDRCVLNATERHARLIQETCSKGADGSKEDVNLDLESTIKYAKKSLNDAQVRAFQTDAETRQNAGLTLQSMDFLRRMFAEMLFTNTSLFPELIKQINDVDPVSKFAPVHHATRWNDSEMLHKLINTYGARIDTKAILHADTTDLEENAERNTTFLVEQRDYNAYVDGPLPSDIARFYDSRGCFKILGMEIASLTHDEKETSTQDTGISPFDKNNGNDPPLTGNGKSPKSEQRPATHMNSIDDVISVRLEEDEAGSKRDEKIE